MAILVFVFGCRTLYGNERDNLHGQVQHRHTEEYTANPVDEYVYLCSQLILIQLSLLLAVTRQAGVSSRNELHYSIAAGKRV